MVALAGGRAADIEAPAAPAAENVEVPAKRQKKDATKLTVDTVAPSKALSEDTDVSPTVSDAASVVGKSDTWKKIFASEEDEELDPHDKEAVAFQKMLDYLP